MMNGLLKETFALKFNKALTMQKSKALLNNLLLLGLKKISVLKLSIWFCRPDFEAGSQDFRNRLANYEKVVPEIAFIVVLCKDLCFWMLNMV